MGRCRSKKYGLTLAFRAQRPHTVTVLMPCRSLLLLLVLTIGLGACKKRGGDAENRGSQALPPLVLTDQTPELLLTWIDTRGDTHTAVRLTDVPAEGRNPVRIVPKDAGQGLVFYIADLTLKQGDGSYPVRTMSRGEWEGLLETRRARSRPAAPPPAVANGAEAVGSNPNGGVAKNAGSAVIYGAEWCGPCHQAQKHLKRRGVAVTFYDIEKEPQRASEMRKKLRAAGRSGNSGIPVIELGGQVFVGFNPNALDHVLDNFSDHAPDHAPADAQRSTGTPI